MGKFEDATWEKSPSMNFPLLSERRKGIRGGSKEGPK
jgi:hypothetical protein